VSAHDHDHDHDHDEHEHDELDDEAREEVETEARRRLALAQIRQYPDAALRLRAKEVEAIDDDIRRLAERMIVLMHDAQGVGLAATQVGVLRRVVVVEDEGAKIVVNPKLVDHGAELETDEEGCLSLQGVRVPVERPVKVVVEGKNEQGEDVRYELEGLPARVVQHELDHLDGVLIIDRTDDEHRKQALSVLRPRVVLR
jgi:peptide deformylase